MTVVYLDSVFMWNAVLDYLLLLVTARFAGLSLHRKRYLAAALLGGCYAVAVFLPGMEFLSRTPVRLVAGILLALTAFGGERCLFRLILLLFLFSCALAGTVLALELAENSRSLTGWGVSPAVKPMMLAASAAAALLAVGGTFRACGRAGVRNLLLPVSLCVGTQVVRITALLDTGNALTDPGTGRPVPVVDWHAVRKLFPGVDAPGPEALERLWKAAPELQPGLIAYHSAGMRQGLLLTVRTRWTVVNGRKYEGLRIALIPQKLGDGYSALWGGECAESNGGKHGRVEADQKLVDMAGTAAPAGTPLYRRQ